MSGPFARRRDGSIDVTLHPTEALALTQVADNLLETLRAPETPDARRLFPPAYENDPDKQEEFSVMTRMDLTQRKRANAELVREEIGAASRKRERVTLRLDPEGAQAWLGMLNDARLLLGERLNVTEDMEPGDDPEKNIYAWLSGMEWALVDALMG